jgi:hypothetical protein
MKLSLPSFLSPSTHARARAHTHTHTHTETGRKTNSFHTCTQGKNASHSKGEWCTKRLANQWSLNSRTNGAWGKSPGRFCRLQIKCPILHSLKEATSYRGDSVRVRIKDVGSCAILRALRSVSAQILWLHRQEEHCLCAEMENPMNFNETSEPFKNRSWSNHRVYLASISTWRGGSLKRIRTLWNKASIQYFFERHLAQTYWRKEDFCKLF